MAFIKYFCCFLVISLAEGKIRRDFHAPPPIVAGPFATNSTAVWANITQYLDHFDPTNVGTWQMRYLYNNVCFKSGGPIVLFLGGEWIIDDSYLTAGAVYDIACGNNGYMFYTEHRFYGKSYPTNDFSTANLKYLSADQALGDLAYFVQYVKANNPQLANSKVIVIGRSYSATLATWARIKYPHLFDIAYASSGPVRDIVDYFQYFEVVATNINAVSQTCYGTIQSAFAQMVQLLNTPQGVQNVSKLFNTCETINTADTHRSFFFYTIAQMFADLVQYALEGDIEFACGQIANYTGSAVEKLGSYAGYYYDTDCIPSYAQNLKRLGSLNVTTFVGRQWNYQICSEFGWLQTSDSVTLPLFSNTFSADFCYQRCKDLYGQNFGQELLQKAVARTNLFYGSNTPAVTRLITVQGTVDPWHPAGILTNLNSQTLNFLVSGTSHCEDMNSIANVRSQEMKQVMQTIRDTITQWLKVV